VTRDFEAAFRWRLPQKPPRTRDDALRIAKTYAWLSTRTRPGRLEVLEPGALPPDLSAWLRKDPESARAVTEQIVKPRVTARRLAPAGEKAFTVEFCARSRDFWGDIYFWHVEVGPGFFSVSRRPVYRAPRVLE
jgi:hypothetical protein